MSHLSTHVLSGIENLDLGLCGADDTIFDRRRVAGLSEEPEGELEFEFGPFNAPRRATHVAFLDGEEHVHELPFDKPKHLEAGQSLRYRLKARVKVD